MSTLAPVPTDTMPHEASVSQSSIDNTAAQAIEGSPINMSDKNVQGKTYSRRVVLHTTATAAELASGGKQLEIPDAQKIFSPDFSDKEVKELLGDVDTSKGIITKVEVLSIYNNAPAPVTFGMKLFQLPGSSRNASCNDLKVTNESGWLYNCSKNDLGEQASHSKNNFTNLIAMQPFERNRVPEGMTVYKPNNVVNNRFISEYGRYDWKSLWNNIVQFPGENFYYVDKSHVILKVIENNWELLGLDLRAEIPREGKYVKVATQVADRVIKELYDNIISKIPFTSFKNLKAVFSSDAINVDVDSKKEYQMMTELRVSFVYPALGASEETTQ